MNPDTGIWLLCQNLLARHKADMQSQYAPPELNINGECRCSACGLARDVLTELVVRRTRETAAGTL